MIDDLFTHLSSAWTIYMSGNHAKAQKSVLTLYSLSASLMWLQVWTKTSVRGIHTLYLQRGSLWLRCAIVRFIYAIMHFGFHRRNWLQCDWRDVVNRLCSPDQWIQVQHDRISSVCPSESPIRIWRVCLRLLLLLYFIFDFIWIHPLTNSNAYVSILCSFPWNNMNSQCTSQYPYSVQANYMPTGEGFSLTMRNVSL